MAEIKTVLSPVQLTELVRTFDPSRPYQFARAIEAAVLSANAGKVDEWLPIETAPKDDGILVCQSRNGIIKTARGIDRYGNWKTGPGHMDYLSGVTHYMPLPAAPTQQAIDAGKV